MRTMTEATETVACESCGGDRAGCDFCYRGRISGFHQEKLFADELTFVIVSCNEKQRRAVDRWIERHP